MLAVAVLLLAVVAACADWWSVARDKTDVERFAKPITMLLLVAVAATWGDAPGDVRIWLVLGALFGVAGDVALLARERPRS